MTTAASVERVLVEVVFLFRRQVPVLDADAADEDADEVADATATLAEVVDALAVSEGTEEETDTVVVPEVAASLAMGGPGKM